MLIALAGFALAASITRGPNNIMLMASRANFGGRQSPPHMLGITLGLILMVVLVGAELIWVYVAIDTLHLVRQSPLYI